MHSALSSLAVISVSGVVAFQAAPPAAPPAGRPSGASPSGGVAGGDSAAAVDWKTRSIWTLETKTLEGAPVKLSQYQGKVALVVNVASKCGMTPQYEALQALAEEYKDKGVVVLGFPCNDFGNQEPGSATEIRDFCTSRFKITFPLFDKVSVKPGEQQSPLYRALEAKTGKTPRWNFGKYLVSPDGVTAEYFDSKVAPDSKELRAAIDKAIAAAGTAPGGKPAERPAGKPEQKPDQK